MSDKEHGIAPARAGRLVPSSRWDRGMVRAGYDRMLIWLAGLVLLLAWLPAGEAQFAPLKVYRIDLKHIGPPATSDELVRSNLRVRVGDTYLRTAVDDDVRSLYATGFFYNIQVTADDKPDGVILTYKLQGKPRLTEIRFTGNTKFKSSKLLKKISSKADAPLDERKLFGDTQEIEKMYQKSGYPHTKVKYVLNIDENAGRGTATFQITESPKVKILKVNFVTEDSGPVKAFSLSKLRKTIKTRKRWMFSWITGSGYFKEDQFEEDKDKLRELYRDKGYIDFEIKEVQFLNQSPREMIIQFKFHEGTQYKVGSVKFSGNKKFTAADISQGLHAAHERSRSRAKIGPNGLPMDMGDIFTPGGITKDTETVQDFYGAKGYIDVTPASGHLNVLRVPNTEMGTMDLEFQIDEGQESYIEKIEIRGNVRTKDKVIRREMAVAPGERFDMVRVKLSKQRLEGLGYFDRVDTRPEPSDAGPNRKNLIVDVNERQTGHLRFGAGFNSEVSLFAVAEYREGNFQAPWYRGGGQKLRLTLSPGLQLQHHEITFIEPWFLDRKLELSVSAFYREFGYLSPNNIYDLTRVGFRTSLERALGSDFLRGGVSYSFEDVGVSLADGANQYPTFSFKESNVPTDISDTLGHQLLSTAGVLLAYDTRNSVKLPNKGQRTEVVAQLTGGPLGGSYSYYRLELHSAHYFRGLLPGHVLELGARTGVMQSFGDTSDVPFFERYYLGGLSTLRGFKFRYISPRQVPNIPENEPIGGDTYWFGTAEYSIPVFEQENGLGVRLAAFYDVGTVGGGAYNYNISDYNDNWGLGLRVNIPMLGPLRFDYGVPIHHDQYNSGSGKFQFSVGWERPF
jgi:outer membrane protein insertion porin family